MKSINLLPWRERAVISDKKRLKKTLFVSCVVALVFVVLVCIPLCCILIIEKNSVVSLAGQLSQQRFVFDKVSEQYYQQIRLGREMAFLSDEREKENNSLRLLISAPDKRLVGMRLESILLDGKRFQVSGISHSHQDVQTYLDVLEQESYVASAVIQQINIDEQQQTHFVIEGVLSEVKDIE